MKAEGLFLKMEDSMETRNERKEAGENERLIIPKKKSCMKRPYGNVLVSKVIVDITKQELLSDNQVQVRAHIGLQQSTIYCLSTLLLSITTW